MDLPTLHLVSREIFSKALKSVDAYAAVRRTVRLEDSRLRLGNTTFDLTERGKGIYAVALGKAAGPMASALSEILGKHLTAGIIAAPQTSHLQSGVETPPPGTAVSPRWRVFEGGHPLPNRASLAAGRSALSLLRLADRQQAPVIFLISGGGSTLMEWPRDEGTTLEELRAANEALIASGAGILEINAVRRAISAVKGGGLARSAPHCPQVSLIVADTNRGEEASVASGPSFEPPADAPDPASVIHRYELEKVLPQSILKAVQQPFENPASSQAKAVREHYVLLDSERALVAATESATSLGFAVVTAHELVEQPIAEGCSLLLSRLFDLSRHAVGTRRGACLISGGEFACPVKGRGVGGRNAESVLRWAIELDARNNKGNNADQNGARFLHAVALSAGTDGIDGNSPAAGALCDETSILRARQLNLDASRFLDESDAHTFFTSLGDTIITGPTGTNVRDLRIMIAT